MEQQVFSMREREDIYVFLMLIASGNWNGELTTLLKIGPSDA